MLAGFFFKGFCDVAKMATIHKLYSGYMPDMKVEKNQDLSIFLATYWNLL
jgi:hypothetical protein